MKQTFIIIIALIAGMFITSCEKDEGAKLYDVTVSVIFPEGYTVTDMSGVSVKCLNTVSSKEETATTDASGTVMFKVEAGTYTFSATMTTEEFVFNGITQNQQVDAQNTEFEVDLVASAIGGGLVFKEIYYTGSRTPEDKSYYADQFHEIYNNSDEVIYLDGLCIGVLQPTSSSPSDWVDDQGNLLDVLPITYHTWMWPGTGEDYPLQPRTSVVLAQDGIDHQTDPAGNPNSPVNLGNADWETYVEWSDKDTDSPGVPNLICIYTTTTSMYDWLHPVFGGAVVIFRLPTGLDYDSFVNNPDNFMTRPGSTSTTEYLMVHKDWVIDAVEIVRVEEDKRYKRLPIELDAGYTFCSGTYISKSIRRKVDKIIDGKVIYKDTNNSSEDFLGDQDPTPFVHPSTVD
ncbi:MAG TPA: DUF4876 domain-containing protein [Bacteroidetes bacterium]|nr:DUF4876 domain-containing protein [Bacteroidota bacterium]